MAAPFTETIIMHKTLLLVAMLSLAGCVNLPEMQQAHIDLPQSAKPVVAHVAPDWWKAYNDPVLNKLMDEALTYNADLRLAAARVDEARGNLGLADGARYPTVGVNAGASRTRSTQVGSFPIPSAINNSFQAGVQASYVVDFWGQYRYASEAAKATLLASEYGRDAVRVSLTSTIAKTYFALRALDAQRLLARQTAANRQKWTALQKLRFDQGDVSELVIRQAEADQASVESALAQLERQADQQETALAVLLGRSPRQLVEDKLAPGSGYEALPQPPEVPAGLPSDLLTRRPDIRQAEATLAAADADIAATRAAIFPSLTLTANLGSQSKALSDLFTSPANVWGLAANLAQTIYNAGRTEAAVRVSAARREQALINYEKTVRQAFRETLDALIARHETQLQSDAENQRVTAQRRALELAELRFKNGESNYLEVLDAQRGLYSAEQNRVEARRAQLTAVADLDAALGGGWETRETQ
jgi:multidrug efflux system outer membrane protein